MNKVKKADLQRALSNIPDSREISVGDFSFVLKSFISPEEQAAFVEAVVESTESGGHRYYGLFDYAFRLQAISIFTNLPLPAKSDDRAKCIVKETIITMSAPF